MLRVEIKRALNSRMFYLTLLLGVAALLPGLYSYLDGRSPALVALDPFYFNSYEGWLWAYMDGLMPVAVPLLVTLPAASSYLQDKQTGYLTFLLMRGHRSSYLRAKIISNFLSGGLSVFIPLLILFAVTYTTLPAGLPKQLRLLEVGAFGFLLRPAPLLYILILSGVGFLFGGVYATFALSLSAVTSSRYVVMAAPFVLFHVANFGLTILRLEHWTPPVVLVPFAVTTTSWVTVLGGLAIPAVISALLLFYMWRKEFSSA
ncbi:MAG: hypothetical protein L6E13_04750 [Firmicutes bacterium]|nr:hypothetical protein [Bacillota bacterium]